VEQRAVASDHDDVRIAGSAGRRELDRVMSAQSVRFSQLAGVASERRGANGAGLGNQERHDR
jgi:hypothetical protein